ncbi:hypothetical protein THAOC_22509 [Thalassiosira oceanica]|uniref:Uncharacterized protein n=1 Tax=Thalassiosira oceanica TaxID=159749 RepID=K0RWR9_THAOC|nr:hypothetical protein THAOC_22509 [Thalassiosira oceanica]|eukprot:EJK57445.1 hypothetical protein THAOC_22509 [Thalassiosira oceanica]
MPESAMPEAPAVADLILRVLRLFSAAWRAFSCASMNIFRWVSTEKSFMPPKDDPARSDIFVRIGGLQVEAGTHRVFDTDLGPAKRQDRVIMGAPCNKKQNDTTPFIFPAYAWTMSATVRVARAAKTCGPDRK